MILGVSIGNTNIRCAVGTKGDRKLIDVPTKSVRRAEDFIIALEEGLSPGIWGAVRGSIISSVVSENVMIVTDAIRQKTNELPQRVDIYNLNVDISKYGGGLGEDRAVCCCAALSLYPPPIIVIDLGTASTINLIDKSGVFAGGAIFVGVQTGLNALCEYTSQLPKISDCSNVTTIGNDTAGCLISGAVIGTANMLEGYISRIGTELGGSPAVVITGGNAPAILPYCRFKFIHKPTLLIDELFSLYKP